MSRIKSFFRAEKMSWHPGEALIMRLAFALVVVLTGIIWNAAQLPAPGTELKSPNGLANILPMQWLANPGTLALGKPLVAVSLGFYVFGWAPVFSLFVPLVFMLGTGALRNSMGDISHHTQLVAMVLLAQWVVYLVAAIRRRSWLRTTPITQQQVIFWSILVIGASYLASGIVKLKASDLEWIQRVPALSVQVFKAVWSASYSTGEPVSGFKAETVPWLIVNHPHLARLFFGTGLLLELLGFLMVLGKRVARWTGIALISMHLGISLLMEIDFINHILLVLIFAVNIPGWFMERFRRDPVSMAAGTSAAGDVSPSMVPENQP